VRHDQLLLGELPYGDIFRNTQESREFAIQVSDPP